VPATSHSSRVVGSDLRHIGGTEQRDRGASPDGDDELTRRARLGDKAAFTELVERHGPAMYRFGLRLLRDEPATEDCVQDALLAAWQSIDRFRGESTVKTWLFGILAHTVRHHVRTHARRPALVELAADPSGPVSERPHAQAEASELLRALEAALAELPPMQRACWMLREIEGMSYEQIAHVQATTVSTVRGALHRARRDLERRLEPWR